MARIRTIKPAFWTDEKIGKLPIGARLLFIGCWNMADDEGILLWNAAYIRGQLFPYDTKLKMTTIKQWMFCISSTKLVALYDDDTTKTWYAFIPSWHRHQVINRPQPTQHPAILDMINVSNSLNNHGVFTEHSVLERRGREEEKEEREEGNDDSSLKLFNSFKNDARYDGVDFENEYSKLCEQYKGKTITKLICHRWLDDAIEYQNNHGRNKKQSKAASQYKEYTGDENDDHR